MCGDEWSWLQCDMCDSSNAEWKIDPYIREIDDEEIIRALCEDCYQNRKDDI